MTFLIWFLCCSWQMCVLLLLILFIYSYEIFFFFHFKSELWSLTKKTDGPMNLQFKCKCKWCNSNQQQFVRVAYVQAGYSEQTNEKKIDDKQQQQQQAKILSTKRKTEWNGMKQIRIESKPAKNKQQKQNLLLLMRIYFVNYNLPPAIAGTLCEPDWDICSCSTHKIFHILRIHTTYNILYGTRRVVDVAYFSHAWVCHFCTFQMKRFWFKLDFLVVVRQH